MKKIEVAKMIGIGTRQHLEFVLAGKRNFSYQVAKKATVVIGGSLSTWMDTERVKERNDIWRSFQERVAQEV